MSWLLSDEIKHGIHDEENILMCLAGAIASHWQFDLTMDRPIPLYENIVLDSSFEAARTVILLPLFSSYRRHCGYGDYHVRACAQPCGGEKICMIPHLLAQVPLPELAVSSTTSHSTQKVLVDLNHLLHGLRS